MTLSVLRLCSVFEPVSGDLRVAAGYDPIGGTQNHTAALTRCLDGRGVVQTVVTSRLGGPVGRTSFGRHAEVRRVGVRLRRLRQLWGLAALTHVLRPGRPVDVVHAHQGEDVATLLLGLLAAAAHRCPLVVTVHASVRFTVRGRSPRALLLRTVGAAVETLALRRAAAVIVLARRTEALLRRAGLPRGTLHVIPSGFDPALFAGPHADAFDVPRPRVGYVGRLAVAKRPDLLVEAFGRVDGEASLVVVGDGPLRERVEALARRSPASDRITFTGFVDHDCVPGVLASLDVLVLPSDYEELGSVLTEAMAAGLPVVATRVGGIPEVVEDGVTGLLVPPGDVEALADAVEKLVADPALRHRMADQARARSGRWSWPELAGRVARVYDEVRQTAGARRPVGPSMRA
ncbi:MAG: glycosyltransferase family 4 protein [Actinomycetota bacterium]